MADTNVLQAGRWLDNGGAVVNIAHPDHAGPSLGSTTATWDAALESAIDSLDQTAGGVVKFPPGYTYLLDSVNLSTIWSTKAFASTAKVYIDWRGALIEKHIPANGGTIGHLFHDALGTANGLRWLCGSIDMNRAGFTAPVLGSAWFLDRSDDWIFYSPHVYDGIEEGIKAYKPVNLVIYNPVLDNIRNNGIQVHAPLNADEAYAGAKADRDASHIRVWGGRISNIDDGQAGAADGQAIVFHGTSSVGEGKTVRDAMVVGTRIRDCLRGCWTEFNNVHGEGIHFIDIDHENTGAVADAIYGSGLVGVKHSSVRGGEYRNIGIANPGSGTDTFCVIVSGSGSLRSEDCIVDGVSMRETRSSGNRTEYGIIVRQSDRTAVGPSNRLSGSFKKKRIWVDAASSPAATGKFTLPTGDNRYKLQIASGGQSIPNNTWTSVTAWDRSTPVYDAFGQDENGGTPLLMVDPSTANPERHGINDPVPGFKKLTVNLSYAANGTGQRGIRVSRHGSVSRTISERLVSATSGANESSMGITVTEYMELGDWFEVQTYQNSGGSLSLRDQPLCYVEYEHTPGIA